MRTGLVSMSYTITAGLSRISGDDAMVSVVSIHDEKSGELLKLANSVWIS